jgi:hypothetical protein
MNVAELIVELVLTGLLMLAALLAPAIACERIAFDADAATELLALALGAGFLLGTVVDRCADSILATWEGQARCRFAWARAIPQQRRQLLGGRDATDCFPEDWMRIRVLSHANEGAVHWMEQLRVRVRIARSVAFLLPALSTSAIVALWAHGHPPTTMIAWTPALHVAFLFAAVAMVWWTDLSEKRSRSDKTSRRPHVTQPKTRSFATREPYEHEYRAWQRRSPATPWFALQALASIAGIVAVAGQAPVAAIGIALLGAMLTILACYAWLRIQNTFMAFLWNYCAVNAGKKLANACAGSAPSATGPASDAPAVAAPPLDL